MSAKIALTGGIGSGKSIVGKIFENNGIFVIDADQVARKVTARGTRALDRIHQRFGDRVLSDDLSLDRKALGTLVFADSNEKKWLEQLLHPLIRQESDLQAEFNDGLFCILEIPLLVETGREREMDATIVISCPLAIRRQRVLESRNISVTLLDQIIQSQATDEQRLEIADYIIDNSGPLDSLYSQVKNIIDQLSERFS